MELKVVKEQEMRADVCNCLFTILLIGVRLPDILEAYLHYSEVCKLVPLDKGMCVGSILPRYCIALSLGLSPKEPGLCF